MRNILLSLICLLAAQSVQAQSNQLTQIRKIYADAKKKIEVNGKNGNPRNDLQIINHDQERKGTMEEEEDVRFFYLISGLMVSANCISLHRRLRKEISTFIGNGSSTPVAEHFFSHIRSRSRTKANRSKPVAIGGTTTS